MLFHLLFPLADQFGPFNLFRYLTFRSGGAMVTALLISFLFGPRVIAWLKSKQLEGQPIRVDGPEGHLVRKKGTPTMGGVLILLALIVSTLLWADLGDGYVWVTLLVTVGFGGVGFFDDYKKLTRRSSSGLSSRGKLAAQVAISAVAAVAIIYLTRDPTIKTAIAVPFFKNVLFDLGWAGPGRRLEERLLQLAERPLMNMARVDVGRLPELAQRFDIHGAPALVLFRSGQVAARRLGELADGDLQDWLAGELTA